MRKLRHSIDNLPACPMETTLDIIAENGRVILHRVGEQTRRRRRKASMT